MIIKKIGFLCIGRRPPGLGAAVQVGNMGLRVGVIEKHRVLGARISTRERFPAKHSKRRNWL